MVINVNLFLNNLGTTYRVEGIDRKVTSLSSIYQATENDLSFCYYEGEKGASIISNSNAGIILCKKSMEGIIHPKPGKQQFYFMDDPKFTFFLIMRQIYKKKKMVGISPRAVISETAKIGSGCYIGDYTTIGDNCTIGDDTVIYDKVSIVQNSSIGVGCVIQQGVIIGADGFAYERYPNGELERFPHIKGVKIGNNVEVSSNTTIERGSLRDTIIGDGTKIDSMVLVGHNVNIGKNCYITGGTIIGGSTIMGDMCWTGLHSTLKDRIRIGNNVLIAAGAVVLYDTKDEDIVAGVPAKSIKEKVNTARNNLFLMAGQKKG
jgi:UDP-3-O-[3-hydroxymyristoyl] glucosamine N-acyltransferase